MICCVFSKPLGPSSMVNAGMEAIYEAMHQSGNRKEVKYSKINIACVSRDVVNIIKRETNEFWRLVKRLNCVLVQEGSIYGKTKVVQVLYRMREVLPVLVNYTLP